MLFILYVMLGSSQSAPRQFSLIALSIRLLSPIWDCYRYLSQFSDGENAFRLLDLWIKWQGKNISTSSTMMDAQIFIDTPDTGVGVRYSLKLVIELWRTMDIKIC